MAQVPLEIFFEGRDSRRDLVLGPPFQVITASEYLIPLEMLVYNKLTTSSCPSVLQTRPHTKGAITSHYRGHKALHVAIFTAILSLHSRLPAHSCQAWSLVPPWAGVTWWKRLKSTTHAPSTVRQRQFTNSWPDITSSSPLNEWRAWIGVKELKGGYMHAC